MQDERLKLSCLGHCGSEMMKFLLAETNLKHLKFKNDIPPRIMEVHVGRAPEKYFQTLKFNSQKSFYKFIKLSGFCFTQNMSIDAKLEETFTFFTITIAQLTDLKKKPTFAEAICRIGSGLETGNILNRFKRIFNYFDIRDIDVIKQLPIYGRNSDSTFWQTCMRKCRLII